MRLPFQRSKDPAADRGARAGPGDDTAAVEQARTRARRRLSGALVLLLAGVIGFPLLFETQPRPLPVDTPIEVRAGQLASPPPRTLPPPAADGKNSESAAADTVPSPGASAAATEAPPPVRVATPELPPVAAAASAAPPADAPAAPSAAAEPPAPAAPRSDDGARARALLEGGAMAQAEGRFVVQVGAYTDVATLRQTRQKVERLGLKTYTQVVETAAGQRTRVRIGPYASRAEADATAARLKAAGLPASILAL